MTEDKARKEVDRLIAAARLGAEILILDRKGNVFDKYAYIQGVWKEIAQYSTRVRLWQIKDNLLGVLKRPHTTFTIQLNVAKKFNNELADLLKE